VRHQQATQKATVTRNAASGWIYRASSLTELNRHQEARETLSAAATLFPGLNEIIPYDLACVWCALKRADEAREWLGNPIGVGVPPIPPRI